MFISCREQDNNIYQAKFLNTHDLEYIETIKFQIDSNTSYTNYSNFYDKLNNEFSFTNSFDNSIVVLDFNNSNVKKIHFDISGPRAISIEESTSHAKFNNDFYFFEEFKYRLSKVDNEGNILYKLDLRDYKNTYEPFQSLMFSKDYRPINFNNKLYFSNIFKNFRGNGYSNPVVALELDSKKFSNLGEFPHAYKKNYYGSFYALTSYITYNKKKNKFVLSYPKVSDIQLYNSNFEMIKTINSPILEFDEIAPFSDDEDMYYKKIPSDEWKKVENKTIRYQDIYEKIYFDDVNNIYYRLGLDMPTEESGSIGPLRIIVQILNENFDQIALKIYDADNFDYRSIFVNDGEFYIANLNKMKDDNYIYFDKFKIYPK